MANSNIFTKTFPNINNWIEIGSDEHSESLVRALDEGGLVWESTDQQLTIDDALLALENFLIKWFEENE